MKVVNRLNGPNGHNGPNRLTEIMFEGQVHNPRVFIEALRQYYEASKTEQGELANALSELIISKRVDLAAVRQQLLDAGEADLMDMLNRLVDLIEPYIEEGGVEE